MVIYEKRGYIKTYNEKGNLIEKVRKEEVTAETLPLQEEDLFGDE